MVDIEESREFRSNGRNSNNFVSLCVANIVHKMPKRPDMNVECIQWKRLSGSKQHSLEFVFVIMALDCRHPRQMQLNARCDKGGVGVGHIPTCGVVLLHSVGDGLIPLWLQPSPQHMQPGLTPDLRLRVRASKPYTKSAGQNVAL